MNRTLRWRLSVSLLAALCAVAVRSSAQAVTAPAEQPAQRTLALLPHTQFYGQKYPQHFDAECGWLAQSVQDLDLKYVIGLGDITHNNKPKPWEAAQHALGLLDGDMPLALIPGNHDCPGNGNPQRRGSLLGNYFSIDKLESQPGGVNDGEELWQKVVRRHANVVFVVCGHVSGANHLPRLDDAGQATCGGSSSPPTARVSPTTPTRPRSTAGARARPASSRSS